MTHPAQFKAVLAARAVAKTAHFALHQAALPPVLALAVPAQRQTTEAIDAATKPNTAHEALWGMVVPKRCAKRAVTRNAIKRQAKAAAQRWVSQLPVAAYVLRLRAGFDAKHFPSAKSGALQLALRTELEQLMHYTSKAASV